MKHPHPSGRPIQQVEKKWRQTAFQYPAETFATPRLRPKTPLPVADAIGYKTVDALSYAASDDEVIARIGFVIFP